MSLYTVSISRKRARTRTKEKAHISTNSAPFISTFKNTITSSSDKTWETTLPTPCDITNVTYTPNEPSYSIVAALQTNFHLAILNGHDGNILASFPVHLPPGNIKVITKAKEISLSFTSPDTLLLQTSTAIIIFHKLEQTTLQFDSSKSGLVSASTYISPTTIRLFLTSIHHPTLQIYDFSHSTRILLRG